MEKNPRESGIVRVVGYEDEKGFLEYLKNILENPKDLSDKEIERTPEIETCLEDIKVKLKAFVERYGAEPVKISNKNVYLFNRNKLTEEEIKFVEEEDAHGMYLNNKQAAFMVWGEEDDFSRLNAFSTVTHELMHFNSFQSYQVSEYDPEEHFSMENTKSGEKKSFKNRRVGLNLFSEEGTLFNKLDEAIIQELTVRFAKEFFKDIPFLSGEYASMQDKINKLDEKERISAKENVKSWKTIQLEDGSWLSKISEFSYKEERGYLNRLIDEIYEKLKDRFNSREEVFNLFAQAVLGGQLLPLARIIEEVYGRGSFKRIGEETKYKK